MSLHRLAEERSLAYHRLVAARLVREPELLEEARRRVEGWIAAGGRSAPYAEAWREILDQPLPRIVALPDRSRRAGGGTPPVHPIAGMVPARQRWRLWKQGPGRLRGAATRERGGPG